MLLTEVEAKKRLCGQSVGTGQILPCLGTRCTAWRWGEALRTLNWKTLPAMDRDAETAPPRPDYIPASWQFVPVGDTDDGAHWLESDEEHAARQAEAAAARRGYCGLVGEPVHD